MDAAQRQMNQATYRRLRATLNRTYPAGRFVAIDSDRVVADDADFARLVLALGKAGRVPSRVLIIQAGVEFPETATIFAGTGR